jgi:hypothetical protein
MGIWGAKKRIRYDDNDDGVFGFCSSTLCITVGEEDGGRIGGVSVWRRSRREGDACSSSFSRIERMYIP